MEKREDCPLTGKDPMDPVVCLETDLRKALMIKETMVAVFFDMEKAYNMLCKKLLLIKLSQININARMFNWIKNVLLGQ